MATLSTEPHAVTLQAVDWPDVEPLSAQESNASQPVECDTVDTSLRVQQSLMQPGLQAPSNDPTASRKEKLAAPRASNVSGVEALNGASGKAIAPIDALRDQHHNTPNSVRPRKVIGVDEPKIPSITTHDSDQREPAQHRVLKQELPNVGRSVLVSSQVSSQDADSDTKVNDAVHSPFTTTSPPVSTEGLPTTAVQPSNTLKLDGNPTKLFPGKKSIPFDEKYCDSLGHGIFLDRRDVPDQALLEAWNQRVLGDLDKCVQSFWRNKLPGSGILPTNEFKMVGKRHKDELFAEPTIVITCPTKEDQKKVKRFLRKLKPRFLESFKAKVRVEYTRTGGTVYAGLSEGSTSTARHQLGGLRTLSIEGHNKQSANCGLKLRFEMSQRGVEKRSYATLGGIIAIGETLYGITTAHTFLADLQKEAPSAVSVCSDDTDDSSHVTTSDPDTDTDISAAMESIYPSSVVALHFETLYNSLRLQSRMVWSFQGQVLGTDHTVESTLKISDWVVFAIGHTLTLPNLHKSQELLSFIPEPELTPGEVSVLCEVDGCYNGFLTLSNASVHTKNGAMNVREVLLDSPLPLGSSGAWIIRGDRTCGYVVAITRRGLSCFMIPIERALQEIEIVFGKKVNLRRESETVDSGPKFGRPAAADRIEVQSPSSPVPSGQDLTKKAERTTSFVEQQDRIQSVGDDMLQENPRDEETEATGGHAEIANQSGVDDFVFPETYYTLASAHEHTKFFDEVISVTSRCDIMARSILLDTKIGLDSRRRVSLDISFSIITPIWRKPAFPRLALQSIVQHLGTIQLTWTQIGEYVRKHSPFTVKLILTLVNSLECLLYALDILDEFVSLNSKSRRTMTQSWKRMSMVYNLPEVQKHFKGLACNAENLRKLVMV